MGCGGSKTGVTESRDKQEKPKELATNEKPKEATIKDRPEETTKELTTDEKQKEATIKGIEEKGNYEISALNVHNACRSRHGAPDMTLNRDLCDMAQKYAEYLLKKNLFEHGNSSEREWKGEGVGENLGKYVGSSFDTYDATQNWYDEIKDYDYVTPDFSGGVVGHFTQLVWKDSKHLGVGIAKDPRTMTTIMVARYHPVGNVVGEFAKNVSRPI